MYSEYVQSTPRPPTTDDPGRQAAPAGIFCGASHQRAVVWWTSGRWGHGGQARRCLRWTGRKGMQVLLLRRVRTLGAARRLMIAPQLQSSCAAHTMPRLEEGRSSRQQRLGQVERLAESCDVASTSPRTSTQLVVGHRDGLQAGARRGWTVLTPVPAAGVAVRSTRTFCAVHLPLRSLRANHAVRLVSGARSFVGLEQSPNHAT